MEKPQKSNLTQDPQRSKLVEQPPTPATQTQPEQLEQAVTKAVAEPEKRVRVKLLRDTVLDDKNYKPGEVILVTEEQASWLCAEYGRTFSFVGVLEGSEPPTEPILRAIRLDQAAA